MRGVSGDGVQGAAGGGRDSTVERCVARGVVGGGWCRAVEGNCEGGGDGDDAGGGFASGNARGHHALRDQPCHIR